MRILVAQMGNSKVAPRADRLIRSYVDIGCNVTTFSLGEHPKANFHVQMEDERAKLFFKFLSVMEKLTPYFVRIFLFNLRWRFAKTLRAIQHVNFDIVFVEDIRLLPIISQKFPTSVIVFDAREYYPGQYTSARWRLTEQGFIKWICRRYLEQCDLVMMVNEAIASKYSEQFTIQRQVIVRNMPKHNGITADDRLKLTGARIRMVHHGMAKRNRHIEDMIELCERLGLGYELHLYLKGDQDYIDELRQKCRELTNIIIHEPVEYHDLIPTLATYDVGLYFFSSDSYNGMYCLPNKFFEFLHAGLYIAITPNLEMKKLLTQYRLGFVSSSFAVDEFANEFMKVPKELILKHIVPTETVYELSYETDFKNLNSEIQNLLNSKRSINEGKL